MTQRSLFRYFRTDHKIIRRMRSLQTFAAVYSSVHNLFRIDRSLSSRPVYKQGRAAALAEWCGLCAN